MAFTLRQVRYFVATAELGQISQAALHLSISQSAVTSAIQDLELLLGTTLFIRSAQGMTLTDSGRNFLNHAYSILRSVEDALQSPLPQNNIEGSLRVAASYTVMGYFLPYHLQRLAQYYPGIHLQLFEQERQHIEQSLLDGTMDMAVVLTDNLRHPAIASETLFSSSRRLWLASHHPLSEKIAVDLSDVARQSLISLTVDEAEDTAKRYWEASGLQHNVILRTTSLEAVRSMVANGSGVAILSDLVYRPWSLEGKRIDTRSLPYTVPTMSVGLAWLREREFSKPMVAFREYFQHSFMTPQVSSHRR